LTFSFSSSEVFPHAHLGKQPAALRHVDAAVLDDEDLVGLILDLADGGDPAEGRCRDVVSDRHAGQLNGLVPLYSADYQMMQGARSVPTPPRLGVLLN